MTNNDKIDIQEYLELHKRLNEHYYQNSLDYNNRLEVVQSTKAWKLMCLARRINEQFLKGNTSEKKQFLQWLKLKIKKRPVPKNLELARFSPIQLQKIEHYKIPDYTLELSSSSELSTIDNSELFAAYPKQIDLFRFPVIEWDFRWQRPQQISVQFEKNGHRVFYFSIETYGLKNTQPTIEEIAKHTIIKELQPNIYWVKLCSNNPLNAYKDKIEGEDLQIINQSIEYLKLKFNIGATYSILDLPFWANVSLSLDNNITIYDCMDDHEGFSTNSSEMLSNEENLIYSSDIVLASSQRLYEKMIQKNPNTLLVRNAGEYNHFSKKTTDFAGEVRDLKGPIIGYYGAISEWFDIELIRKLAKRNPSWTFVLVGNTFGCDVSHVEKMPNVILTGEVTYESLPSYLYKFDVCLIPFLINNLTLATNPVKVYEYLAAGKPVVSSKLPELEYMKELVYLADTVEDFETSIQQSLSENNKQLVEERKKYAANNTWETRYHEIKQYLINQQPKVSIVIVTYNNWSYTKQCLESLIRNNEYSNFEIIIVDNNSTDETKLQLARIANPNIKVVFSPVNLGFAGGNKAGCNLATGEYIILLNNDTIVTQNWIEKLIKPLVENHHIGMAGPVSNSVGNDQMLDFCIANPISGPSNLWLQDFNRFNKGNFRYTDLLGFYCVAIKKEVYEKAGDLDINYGIGMFEDDDYCEKVKSLGYKLVIVEDVFIYHHGSVSFKKLQSEHYRNIWEKNRSYFEQKWNKNWAMPKPPNSLFLNLVDSTSIATKVKEIQKDLIVIIGEWSSDNLLLKQFVENKIEDNKLVIVVTKLYNAEEYHGLRKVTENLYITNTIDLISKVTFHEKIQFNDFIDASKLNAIKEQVKDIKDLM
ncbi:glycosyltransferase [Lysinibacillus fusiformis]|uniref:glycosyltransferase n=1 Tax=Lysinibacillus fusiformis TaxID=28031 RepID=UPI002E1F4599|nr:glycosyltransferase [Lysinibacillus fusiformis]